MRTRRRQLGPRRGVFGTTRAGAATRGRVAIAGLALLGIGAFGCDPEGAAPTSPSSPPPPGESRTTPTLLSSTILGTYTVADVGARHPEIPGVLPWIVSDITTWSITYSTTADGSPVVASGSVIVPSTPAAGGPGPFRVIAYHHGTLFPWEEPYAPSYDHPGNFETWFTAAVLASSGRVVCVPDYVGYGASAGLEHPYLHAESQAIASVDAIRAALDLMGGLGLTATNDVVITGYSEGGSAALATSARLEQMASPPLLPSLTVPLAGAYSITDMADSILPSTESHPNLDLSVWTIRTYDHLHGLDRPLAHYFRSPWAGILSDDPFAPVTTFPDQLFTSTFITGIVGRTDTQFVAALAANDTHGWAPVSPVRFLHGTADEVVPFFLSEIAVAEITASGGDATLEPLAGLDHAESERVLARRVLELLDATTSVPEI